MPPSLKLAKNAHSEIPTLIASQVFDTKVYMEIMSSERLVFRTWDLGDIENAFTLWGNSEVMTFIAKNGFSREQTSSKLESEISCLEKNGVQYWPLFQKSDGAFIGCCGLKPWTYSEKGGFELGFHFLPKAWGKGFAREAAESVIGFAIERHVSHLMAGHHPENIKSKKILEKLGFQYVENVFFPPTGLMHPSYILPLQKPHVAGQQ
jgi:RimJ/RimL family protein N-acetyltransferase